MAHLPNVEFVDHQTLRNNSTIPSGASILAHLNLDKIALRSTKPYWKRPHYKAVINWLIKYKPREDASNIEKVKGFLESFQHLCQADDWARALIVLVTKFDTPTHDDFGAQLGVWGYYHEQAHLYSQLYKKINRQIDALCLRGLAAARHAVNAFEDAQRYYEESHELFEEHGQALEAAWVIHSLGLLKADQSKDREARLYYERALEQFRKLKYWPGIASVLNDLARVETNEGLYVEARKHYEESLNIHLHHLGADDSIACAWVHYNFGRFLADCNIPIESRKYTKKAFDLFLASEHKHGIAWSHYSLGILMVNEKEYDGAWQHTNKALELFKELGDRGGMAWAHHIMGRVALNIGNYEIMEKHYYQSLSLHYEQLNKSGLAYALEGYAHIAIAQNDFERGVHLFGAAEALREETKLFIPYPDLAEYEKGIAAIRDQLDESTFLMAWTSGRMLPLEEAIAEALCEK